jgi:hypothetical protein
MLKRRQNKMTDNFAEVDDKSQGTGESRFRKTEWLKLDPGQHIVRLLEQKAAKKYAHYINRSYVECLGDDCPICENNSTIRYENPDDFRDRKDYSPRRERFFVNVLDVTPAKVCTNCGKETKNTNSSVCGTCNEPLGEVKPLNKVFVLSSGPRLFEDLNTMITATRTEQDEIVDPRAYNFLLVSNGEGRDRTVTPVPQFKGSTDIIDTENLELFDLNNCIITLEKEELLDLHNGTSLKDIFALRRAQNDLKEGVDEFVPSKEVQKDIKSSVDDIFKS